MSHAIGDRSMTTRKPLVIVTRKLPEAVETRMRELFNARLNLEDVAMTQAALAEAMASADVLVPTITDRIDAPLIAKAGPNLKLIANFGAGVDNIDVAAAHGTRASSQLCAGTVTNQAQTPVRVPICRHPLVDPQGCCTSCA